MGSTGGGWLSWRAVRFPAPAHGSQERVYRVLAVYALTLAGEVEDAESAVTAGIDSARRAGDRFAVALFSLYRAHLRAERGQLLAAEEDLDVPEVISPAALSWVRAYRAPFLTDVLLARGEFAEAEALLAEVGIEGVAPGRQIHFFCARGRVYLEMGRLEQALADFRRAGELAASIGGENPAYCAWRSQAASALHRSAQLDAARELAREELETPVGRTPRDWGLAPRARAHRGWLDRRGTSPRSRRCARRLSSPARACARADRPRRGVASRQQPQRGAQVPARGR